MSYRIVERAVLVALAACIVGTTPPDGHGGEK